MIIHVPNKNTLIIDEFKFKCCVGKKGLNSNKKEGDYTTPIGLFRLKKLYFRKDRVGTPECKITKKIIKRDMAYRKDHRYDYIISISHNEKKVPGKGSAVFIHLTDDYKPTAGCIALKRKDFEIFLKLINEKTKIKIG